MALAFPSSPNVGDRYPADPGTSGVTQYVWSGTSWNVVPSVVSLGTANQDAYNTYQWPTVDGTAGYQLETDGAGNLTWEPQADLNFQALNVTPVFDGLSNTYTLVEYGTATFVTPVPATNIVVFLGGVPQIPTLAYSVAGDQITFTDPPPVGTDFYAFTSVLA